MIFLHFTGCNTADGTGYPAGREKICTLIGGVTSIKINLTSPDPLPPNLAFAFNGKEVDIDECTPKSFYVFDIYNPIKINQNRSQVIIDYVLNLEDYKFYFPDGLFDPTSSLMNLILYSRAKCTDSHTQLQEISDIGISWEPVYINGGKHCGVDAYTGESHIDL
jgi:hypothetical protein